MSYDISIFSHYENENWKYTQDSTYSEVTIRDNFRTPCYLNGNISSILDYHNSLDRRNLESGLLPPGLRYSIPGFLVFERPPTYKLVKYIDYSVDEIANSEDYSSYDEDDEYSPVHPDDLVEHVYEIPVPWQIYFVTYSTSPGSKYRTTYIKMFFSNTPLVSPDTRLYMPYINNFFADASLCNPMFDEYGEISRYSQDLEGVIASAYDWVWNTGFNADLSECIYQTCDQISNNVVDNPKMKSLIQKYHSNFNNTRNFYSLLSKIPLEDVASSEWANPAYCGHFEKDKDFIFNHSQKYRKMYMDQLEDPSDYDFSEFVHFVGPVNHIKKTYSSIIYHLFVDSLDYPHSYNNYNILNQNIPQLSSFDNYLNGMTTLCIY